MKYPKTILSHDYKNTFRQDIFTFPISKVFQVCLSKYCQKKGMKHISHSPYWYFNITKNFGKKIAALNVMFNLKMFLKILLNCLV